LGLSPPVSRGKAIKEKDMRRRSVTAFFALFFAAGAPALAWAVPGFSTGNVNMRAGPSTANPVVATIPSGSPVEIVGCLAGWSWCDTVWTGSRGWVIGAYLNAAWRGRAVPFVSYAPRLGVPIVVYNGPAYWRRYYAGRPWFIGAPVRRIHGCVRGRYGRVVCR
jgi:uncharacterized protein YraI